MTDDFESGRRFTINIDRVVIDGARTSPESVESFRRQLAVELRRQLSRPEVSERLRTADHRRLRIDVPAEARADDPVEAARRMVERLQHPTSQQ